MIPWVFWKSIYGKQLSDALLEVVEPRTMPPQGADFVLTSYIPHGKRDVLVFNGLDIES